MKKFLKITLIVIIVLIVLYLVAGFIYMGITEYDRTKNLDLDGETITITEAEYINYIDELYMNAPKYVGKKIIIEGFYGRDEYKGHIFNFIGREIGEDDTHEHNDECEDSHYVGLEFVYDENSLEVGSFIQVTGTLEMLTEGEEEFLVLKDCTVRTDIEKGAETVK